MNQISITTFGGGSSTATASRKMLAARSIDTAATAIARALNSNSNPNSNSSSNAATGVAFDVVVTALLTQAAIGSNAGAGGRTEVDAVIALDALAAGLRGSVEAFRSTMGIPVERSRYLEGVKVAIVAAAAADADPAYAASPLFIDDSAFDGFDVAAATTTPEVETVVVLESAASTDSGVGYGAKQRAKQTRILDTIIWAVGGGYARTASGSGYGIAGTFHENGG